MEKNDHLAPDVTSCSNVSDLFSSLGRVRNATRLHVYADVHRNENMRHEARATFEDINEEILVDMDWFSSVLITFISRRG